MLFVYTAMQMSR